MPDGGAPVKREGFSSTGREAGYNACQGHIPRSDLVSLWVGEGGAGRVKALQLDSLGSMSPLSLRIAT